MSLPQEVKDAWDRDNDAWLACLGVAAKKRHADFDGPERAELMESRRALLAAIERAIAAARHEPVSDADKLAAAVKPWRELVERAFSEAIHQPDEWLVDVWEADAKALLEKPCSTS